MPDVEKTLAALLLNHQSGIPAPAQAVRDLLISVFGGYASIHVIDGAAAQLLGTSPAKLTGFAADGPEIGSNGDHTNDQITIGCAGAYLVSFNGSFSGDAATYTLRLRKNGAAEGSLACGVTLVGGSDQKHIGFAGIVQLSANDVLTIFGEADQAAKNITPRHMQLAAKRVS